MYFDVHLHLQDLPPNALGWFDDNRCVTASVCEEDWSLFYPSDGVFRALGLHPFALDRYDSEPKRQAAIERLVEQCGRDSPTAIGETGLDFRRQYKTNQAAQEWFLVEQAKVAERHSLPLVLHCVRAHGRLLELLTPFGRPGLGVLHAYSGSPEMVRAYTKLGLYFSFGGWMHRSRRAKKACLQVPRERLLLETDAPYMPRSGDASSPHDIAEVCGDVANVLGEDRAAVARLTADNAARLFQI